MQGFSLEDDMVDGDLGDGMELRKTHRSSSRKSHSLTGLTEATLPRTKLDFCNSDGAMAWISKTQQKASWKVPHCAGSLNDLSKDELKDRLRQAGEAIDTLCCELEVAHRYLEGKYQALKILQGKAILDKATSHTKSLLLKSDDRAKALEKEVNSLQWELSFSQLQTKKSEESWEQKYNGLLMENKTLSNSLQERESEFQELRAENSALGRQCLELLSMLNVREQRAYEGSKPQYSPERNTSVLELAVLGACRCPGVVESCPCSRAAAASRKRLIKLQQELDTQRYRREEALMVADAFRIAFEQQLRKRNDEFLLLAEANVLKSHQCKSEGVNKRSPLMDVSEKLRGLLPSSLEIKMPDSLLDSLYRLLDLLNDKEEALAHQRKVSLMLAHSAEELQRKLYLDSQPAVPSESKIPSKSPSDPSRRQSCCQRRANSSESDHLSDSKLKTVEHPARLSDSTDDLQSSPSDSITRDSA